MTFSARDRLILCFAGLLAPGFTGCTRHEDSGHDSLLIPSRILNAADHDTKQDVHNFELAPGVSVAFHRSFGCPRQNGEHELIAEDIAIKWTGMGEPYFRRHVFMDFFTLTGDGVMLSQLGIELKESEKAQAIAMREVMLPVRHVDVACLRADNDSAFLFLVGATACYVQADIDGTYCNFIAGAVNGSESIDWDKFVASFTVTVKKDRDDDGFWRRSRTLRRAGFCLIDRDRHPAVAVERHAGGGHHDVGVDVKPELLAPGVQNLNHADAAAVMPLGGPLHTGQWRLPQERSQCCSLPQLSQRKGIAPSCPLPQRWMRHIVRFARAI